MRIAIVVSAPEQGLPRLRSIAKAISSEAAARGHNTETIELRRGTDARLTGFEYVVFLAAKSGALGSRFEQSLTDYLKSCGEVNGKRGCALFAKSGLSAQKPYFALMRALETVGFILNYSEIVSEASATPALAKALFDE
jgi:hypothetical protein